MWGNLFSLFGPHIVFLPSDPKSSCSTEDFNSRYTWDQQRKPTSKLRRVQNGGSWNEGLLFQKIQSTFECLVRSGRHGSQLLWALEPDWGL